MTGSNDDSDDRTDSPGVPRLGSDEQPAIYVPDGDEGAERTDPPDARPPDGGTATDGGTTAADGDADALDPDNYDAVDVFEGGDLDLRAGSDPCYKCASCDTSCPVAEVDDSFPGPKFQGPEQWRLKRKEDANIDESIISCSNCMR